MSKSDKIKFIEGIFGQGRLSANEENIAVSCPLCKSTDKEKKKLSIRLEDDLNHCWVCGWSSYNLLPLLIKISAGSYYVEDYKKKYVSIKRRNEIDKEVEEIPTLPSDYNLLYKYELSNTVDPNIKFFLNYLKNRNISKKDIGYYCLGFSNDIRYKRRVMIPSFDSEGNINYIVARAIDRDAFPKYINSKNKKTNIIFNELKINWKKRLNIVEGPFDLMKCPENSTCILGSEMNESHKLFSKILENNTPITICLDEDAKEKAMRICKRLMSYNIEAKICDLPAGKDPGSMTKEELAEFIENAKSTSREKQLSAKIKTINTKLKI